MQNNETLCTLSSSSSSSVCSCGRYYGTTKEKQNQKQDQQNRGDDEQQRQQQRLDLDASFVHLLTPLSVFDGTKSSLSSPNDDDDNNNNNSLKEVLPSSSKSSSTRSYLETYQRLEHLLQTTTRARSFTNNNDDDGASSLSPLLLVCEECIERVQKALDADTERLENECRIYEKTTVQEEEKLERWKKAAATAAATFTTTADVAMNSHDHLSNTAQAYRNEIYALQEACYQQQEELKQLQLLRAEQRQISNDLDDMDYAIEVQRNALELQARAFNNDHEQYYYELMNLQKEMNLLSSNIPLPCILFDLQVDKQRGLRYPLINELRLAYRPKGDIQAEEIQAAWSLAAQLLLVIGTMLQFPSKHWKIVPLTNGAKLIFYHDTHNASCNPLPSSSKQQHHNNHHQASSSSGRTTKAVVYQLGYNIKTNNTSKSLLAWNALLHQVILHTMTKQKEAIENGIIPNDSCSNGAEFIKSEQGRKNINDTDSGSYFPKLPYSITATTIADIRLTELSETDDVHWSRAIHCMTSNLLWLSECASIYISQQVILSSNITNSNLK